MRLIALALMQIYFSVPLVDAPELARRGAYSVGVRTVDLVNPGQADILNFNQETGKAPLYDRPLKVEIWSRRYFRREPKSTRSIRVRWRGGRTGFRPVRRRPFNWWARPCRMRLR